MDFDVVNWNHHLSICMAFPSHPSFSSLCGWCGIIQSLVFPLCLFFMAYHLWRKKYRMEKSPPLREHFEKLEVLKSGVGWKKNKRKISLKCENGLETDPKYFTGAKPSTMMDLWNNSSQPTATRWSWRHSRLHEARLMGPSLAGPQNSPCTRSHTDHSVCRSMESSMSASFLFGLSSVPVPGRTGWIFHQLSVGFPCLRDGLSNLNGVVRSISFPSGSNPNAWVSHKRPLLNWFLLLSSLLWFPLYSSNKKHMLVRRGHAETHNKISMTYGNHDLCLDYAMCSLSVGWAPALCLSLTSWGSRSLYRLHQHCPTSSYQPDKAAEHLKWG